MKRRLNLWLMAALLCGMSMSVTSCKDDNNEPSAEEQEQQAQLQEENDNIAFSVLDNLGDLSNAPADFLSGSYEPTIGTADDGNAGTRIVNTNTMELAADRFADLCEVNVDENTPSYTWSDERMGTMVYTKSQDGKSWATVDVNIKQLPHLQKIIFRSPEQAGDNLSFKGTAYYRFGDVVSREVKDGNKTIKEYWICVRPCFGPEGKENSHWVTISPLPSKNVWTYTGSNGIDYALPTGIGDNHEHSQNFAEMLYAICYPKEWQNNIINTDVPMFHDFNKQKGLRYHRNTFWQRVQDAWTDGKFEGGQLLKRIFGTDATLQELQDMLVSEDGLNLLTHGKNWYTAKVGGTNKPTLYYYRFCNGDKKKCNMHDRKTGSGLDKYSSVKAEVIKSKIQINVNTQYTEETPYLLIPKYFGSSNKYFIIRHAKGCELSTDGKEKKQEKLQGVTEVYNYNKSYGITDLTVEPEILDDNAGSNDPSKQDLSEFTGDAHYTVGDVYKDLQGKLWFVVNQSGTTFEHSPYSELVSFEGIETDGKGRATNIATRDQADRGAMLLWAYYYTHDTYWEDFLNVNINLQKVPFSPRDLFFPLLEKVSDSKPTVYAGAYAYQGNTTGKQPLVRFVMNNTDKNNPFQLYLWDKYPKTPDKTTQFVKDFSDQPIVLQDLTDKNMVQKYAEDVYARMSLYSNYPGFKPAVNKPLDDVDEAAEDVRNYFYNYDDWNDRTQHTFMWYDPVLVFRITAVYDRGEKNHATKTVDGNVLTLVQKGYDKKETYQSDIDKMKNDFEATYKILNNVKETRYLNGQKQAFKSWKEVWK